MTTDRHCESWDGRKHIGQSVDLLEQLTGRQVNTLSSSKSTDVKNNTSANSVCTVQIYCIQLLLNIDTLINMLETFPHLNVSTCHLLQKVDTLTNILPPLSWLNMYLFMGI